MSSEKSEMQSATQRILTELQSGNYRSAVNLGQVVGVSRQFVLFVLNRAVKRGQLPENPFSHPARIRMAEERKKATQRQRESKRITQFWQRVDNSAGSDACWPWMGCTLPSGYGRCMWRGRQENAHRIAWSLTTALPIPRGRSKTSELILHSCDNPQCCNPRHLRKGTHQENMNDRDERRRCKPWGRAVGWRKAICKNGHPRSGSNLLVYISNGKEVRLCRICSNESSKRHYYNFKASGS